MPGKVYRDLRSVVGSSAEVLVIQPRGPPLNGNGYITAGNDVK
jgi:hypothetical protein